MQKTGHANDRTRPGAQAQHRVKLALTDHGSLVVTHCSVTPVGDKVHVDPCRHCSCQSVIQRLVTQQQTPMLKPGPCCSRQPPNTSCQHLQPTCTCRDTTARQGCRRPAVCPAGHPKGVQAMNTAAGGGCLPNSSLSAHRRIDLTKACHMQEIPAGGTCPWGCWH